ncbi:MAG TPA: thioesterase family protein [Acidimicrobiales bacterium]|jgi:hypothetical protein|nr:thioesterase family protein [Acidimicrobiales bacterium]
MSRLAVDGGRLPLWADRSITAAFFELNGETLVPRAHAHSARSVDFLHGRLLAGLLARSVEARIDDPDRQCARLTVDLFRPTPLGPVEVTASTFRQGRRIQVIDAVVASASPSGGDPVVTARASATVLRRGETPPGEVWTPTEWTLPGPEAIPPPGADEARLLPWDIRACGPSGLVSADRVQVWVRDPRPLVEGEAVTGLVRAAMVADAANPFANAGTRGLRYINTDITLLLRRPPRSEWIGFEVASHLAQRGIAIGQCTLYDEDGAIGSSSVTAIAQEPLGRDIAKTAGP